MLIENIREAIISIFSNKMRSALTVLGIVIGITAVITITTIGSSIQSTINASMNSLGGGNISLYLQAKFPETDEEWATWEYPEEEDDDLITPEMLEDVLKAFPNDVLGYKRSVSLGAGKIIRSYDQYSVIVAEGATMEEMEQLNLKLLYGRWFSEQDAAEHKSTVVISDVTAEAYFDKGENPIGQVVTLETTDGQFYPLVVVGVYKYNPGLLPQTDPSKPIQDRPTTAFVAVETAEKLTGADTKGYDYVDLVIAPSSDIKTLTKDLKDFMEPYYAKNPDWSVTAYNVSSDLKIIDIVITVVTVAISVIASISLVVGGVGVMNIMLVSITERTKEIGVRMAMGAKKSVIRTQFIIEAIVLCLIGGILGIILGVLIGLLIGAIATFVVQNFYASFANVIIISVRPSPVAIILSLFFSSITGVFFGFYPANKAANMEVIDALRYE